MARVSLYPAKRRKLLEEVFKQQRAHGNSPTIRELSEVLGVVPSTVHTYVALLEAEGAVVVDRRRRRGVKCTLRAIRELTATETTEVPF